MRQQYSPGFHHDDGDGADDDEDNNDDDGDSKNTPTAELQKRADRADQSVLFFLAGANFWGKAREKQTKTW